MLANKDRHKTNEDVFMENFIPSTGLSREELLPIFTAYYSSEYPGLHRYTRPVLLVQKSVELAVAQKKEVVIATNPVFPETAIRQRLQWAGIDHIHYRLVTTYENMHFCKPHLEYYAEILNKLNRSPQECLMIGNGAVEEMAAAGLGIKTFLLKNHLLGGDGNTYTADYAGHFCRPCLPS